MTLRQATAHHMAACEAIYAEHVANGVATFDERPPPTGHLQGKRQALQAKGLPFLVLQTSAGEVLGYAYATPFRDRSAYRFSAEDSIYLAPNAVGRGLAASLLGGLIDQCRGQGLRSLIAVIGMDQDQDPQTNPSVRAHAKAGFKLSGVLDFIGFKFDRWLKTVYMRHAL